jgi:multisubunit Na+/H+ antiporter MnhC subunit
MTSIAYKLEGLKGHKEEWSTTMESNSVHTTAITTRTRRTIVHHYMHALLACTGNAISSLHVAVLLTSIVVEVSEGAVVLISLHHLPMDWI